MTQEVVKPFLCPSAIHGVTHCLLIHRLTYVSGMCSSVILNVHLSFCTIIQSWCTLLVSPGPSHCQSELVKRQRTSRAVEHGHPVFERHRVVSDTVAPVVRSMSTMVMEGPCGATGLDVCLIRSTCLLSHSLPYHACMVCQSCRALSSLSA